MNKTISGVRNWNQPLAHKDVGLSANELMDILKQLSYSEFANIIVEMMMNDDTLASELIKAIDDRDW